MIKKKSIFIIPLLAGLLSMVSCNSNDDFEYEMLDYSGVAITGFSLQSDKDIMNNLDSVFFTIDLEGARIFNADSLPYGTKTNELCVTITSDLCYQLLLTSVGSDGEEKEVDYLTSPNEKINFSNGDVNLKIVSADGEYTRNYKVRVNVHKMSPDSLYWAAVDATTLPTTFAMPKAQKSVRMADKAYCLSTDGTAFCMAVTSDPYSNIWTKTEVNLPAATDVRSLTATESRLHILAGGKLLWSADGINWTETSEEWRSITASYGDILLGTKNDVAGLCYAYFPDRNCQPETIDDDFPVEGNSGCVSFDSKWSAAPQIMTFGGRNKAGEYIGSTWAFDGRSWAKLNGNLPAGEGYAIAKYTVVETDTVTWKSNRNEVILAIGGNQYDVKNGMVASREVYISRDYGMNWRKAYDDLQLPRYIPALYSADMLVFDTTYGVDTPNPLKAPGWMEMPVELPRIAGSRAIKPITSWDCPYLYLIGGMNSEGTLQPTIWRGAVNSLRFRPLQ